MFCDDCSGDKFTTIKVHRNQDRKEGKWLYSNDTDIRLVICDKCGARYHTRTEKVERIKYNRSTNEQFTLALN